VTKSSTHTLSLHRPTSCTLLYSSSLLLQLQNSAYLHRCSTDMHHRKHMLHDCYPASPLAHWLNLQKTHDMTAKHCCVMSLHMCKLHGHKENAAVFLCDVTAYTEVCLPSRCIETGCMMPLFYCCVRVLLRNSCFYSSTILAWRKYATIPFPVTVL
jgi:hypothetical protein